MREQLRFGAGDAEVVLEHGNDVPVRVVGFGSAPAERLQPLVEVLTVDEGHALSNTRLTDSAIGRRLRLVDHVKETAGDTMTLRIRQRDETSGLEVTSVLRARAGVPAVQAWTEVLNTGDRPVVLQAVTSFAIGALAADANERSALLFGRARAEWCAESRWSWTPLGGPDGLPAINTMLHAHSARGSLATTSRSTWSSGEFLPTAMLSNPRTGRSWAWQIEHNGAWRFELDSGQDDRAALALLLSGPTDIDHQWTEQLAAGETFQTVPVAVATSADGWQGAVRALTAHRRSIRRHNAGDAGLPLVFNDYMNTLMGDPTTERLLPLIDAAADAGAEIFCIDAGWYDDGDAWWPAVGEWRPSTRRFPGGIGEVLDRIRARGMRIGLWVEPEVVGVLSPAATRLPDEAFLQRYGARVVEHDRYHLDLRHPAAIAHLDEVFDRLIGDLGAKFFKLDYNITAGAGTDRAALSVGSGLLGHNRAHLAWLDRLVARHPDVVFENCASGAMRMDYAMLSRLDLQSTSDQQDPVLSAAIAAAAPVAVVPEQAGNWAYPETGTPPERIALCMVNGLAGRLYLSGHLDRMTADELALVTEAVEVHREIRRELTALDPVWPLGLPLWTDPVVALGFAGHGVMRISVWNRTERTEPIVLDLPSLRGTAVEVTTRYPTALPAWASQWDPETALLTLRPTPGPAARLLQLTYPSDTASHLDQ